MPFVTDATWTPARYRVALEAWSRNNSQQESKIIPRKAGKPDSPRHAKLADKLKSLLTWRSLADGSNWTSIAANDNAGDDRRPSIDSKQEIRPRISEIYRGLKHVEFAERTHARLGGNGGQNVIPVGGAIERGPVEQQRPGKPACVVRLGQVDFSNGGREERALKRDAEGKLFMGKVRIELGGIVGIGKYRAYDRFTSPKGTANDNQATVGMSSTANQGAVDFTDPIADAQQATWIRAAVTERTAAVLDCSLGAANFTDIGEQLGYTGKNAERRGKEALLRACSELDKVLAA